MTIKYLLQFFDEGREVARKGEREREREAGKKEGRERRNKEMHR